MQTLNNSILDKIIERRITDSVVNGRISPRYNDMHDNAESSLSTALDITKIPSIKYKSKMISSTYKNTMADIVGMIKALADNIKDLEATYIDKNRSVKMAETKIQNSIKRFQKEIDIISNYSCYNVINLSSKQTKNSHAGTIGKFVVLPFFINNTKLYSGSCTINANTKDSTVFSNLPFISSIPFERPPAMKIKGANDSISLALSFLVDETLSNMFYIKMDNDVISAKVSFLNNGVSVLEETYNENEILMNYLPIKFNSIVLTLVLPNQNVDKPLPVRITDMKIFSNIKFSKSGTFESAPEELSNPTSISYVSMNYTNIGDSRYTQANPLLSVSSNDKLMQYNLVNLNENINISLNKFKYKKEFAYSSMSDETILDTTYKKYTILPDDREWNFDFKNAIVLYGLNRDFLNETKSIRDSKGFENWTLVDNYYKTYLLNYEDNVSVNTGASTIIINGKKSSGKVNIPVGISEVSIHKKDIDFSSVDIMTKSTVQNPYNFAYLLTGLPEYNSGGTLIPANKKLQRFNVENTSLMSLNESFIPFSEEVRDEFDNLYTLSMTEMPYIPGTYSILPNSGTIYVCPMEGCKNINVLYYKASHTNKPCGVLFNRLLTFASLPNLLSLKTKDNTLFSFGGTDTERYVILPKIPNISNSQLIYNFTSDKLYFSTKIQLLSENSYITPIINNISLSVK